MKKHFAILAASLLICVTIFISQSPSQAAVGPGVSQLPVGKVCTIQFRRGDALGSGANLPVSPLTNGINGADTSIIGKLRLVSEEWLVLERDAATIWIPKSAILLIQAGN